MNFEEEFPRLYIEVNRPVFERPLSVRGLNRDWICAVQKHTIDKQRVKEAIVEYFPEIKRHLTCCICPACKLIIKLGLEE